MPPTTPHPAPHRLHFATPQASMRYLAVAYNRNDLAALKHVTGRARWLALLTCPAFQDPRVSKPPASGSVASTITVGAGRTRSR